MPTAPRQGRSKTGKQQRAKPRRRPTSEFIAVQFVNTEGVMEIGLVRVTRAKREDAKFKKAAMWCIPSAGPSVPFDSATDRAARQRIASAFDVTGFETMAEMLAPETAKEWERPY